MNHERDDEAEFVERISKPLRVAELVDATFEARLMSAVHAVALGRLMNERRTARRSWWLRPRKVQRSPIVSLAIAAGFAAFVLAGASLVESARQGSGTSGLAVASGAARDTVHVIRFVFVDDDARRVAVVGSFNGWEKRATAMQRVAKGMWAVDVPLARGRHEYAFVVEETSGERWVADPARETINDDFGTQTSVISVGRMPTS
jgi:hypothetical protein